jgi:Flp pilus assembly protein TadG
MNVKSNTHRRERGTVVVEFGLAFLVFMTAVYGIMEFGRIVASYNIISGAAREGSRYAMVHGSASGSAATASDIQTVVRNWAVGLDTSAITVTTTWASGNAPGNPVNVRASYTLTPFSGLILKDTLTVQSTSQTVISQ